MLLILIASVCVSHTLCASLPFARIAVSLYFLLFVSSSLAVAKSNAKRWQQNIGYVTRVSFHLRYYFASRFHKYCVRNNLPFLLLPLEKTLDTSRIDYYVLLFILGVMMTTSMLQIRFTRTFSYVNSRRLCWIRWWSGQFYRKWRTSCSPRTLNRKNRIHRIDTPWKWTLKVNGSPAIA